MKSASPPWIYLVRFFCGTRLARTFRPGAFNSLGFFAVQGTAADSQLRGRGAVLFPPVDLSAWVISVFSVSAKSSGFAVSETLIALPDFPAASRSRAQIAYRYLWAVAIIPRARSRCANSRTRLPGQSS